MGTLYNKRVKDTYKDLLKIASASDNAGIDGNLRVVEDGDATASALRISTDGIKSTGTLAVDSTSTLTGNTTIGGTLGVGTTGTNGLINLKRSSNGAIIGTIEVTDSQLIISELQGSGGILQTAWYGTALRWVGDSSQPRVGIGFSGTISATAHIKGLGTTSATTSLLVQDSAGSQLFKVNDDGKVGIGMTPSYQFQLSTADAYKASGSTWSNPSDSRIKKDIVDADLQRCLEIVKSIPLKHYGYKDGVYLDKSINDKSQLGWIAQEVESVFPKAVQQNKFEYQEQIESTTEVEEYEEKDENGEMIKKTRPKLVPIETIDDCRSLNADQIYKAMFGAIQLLIQKVEALEKK